MNEKGEADMSSSLKYETFGSLLINVVDNRGKTCPTADSGIPLIATNCVVNNSLYPIYEKVRYISEETYKTWSRDHPRPGDMIFVLKGTPGRVAWVPDPVDFCIAQDMVAIRADERKIFPKYLFAVLRSDTIQQQIEGLHVGSLIPHFKKGDFDELKIPIVEPKLPCLGV
jgi:type I restriction enzyme S subunit